MGRSAHLRGSIPILALGIWAAVGCDSAEQPAALSVRLAADFSTCGHCASVEVVLLGGDPPTCTVARSTVQPPAEQAGPQIPAPPENEVTVAAWGECSLADPDDPTAACDEAVRTCAAEEGIAEASPSTLAPFYESLCLAEDKTPLQQCCAEVDKCLSDSTVCSAAFQECATLLGLPFFPGQIDIELLKRAAQSFCEPERSPAECCAALDRCVNGSSASCVACRGILRVSTDASQDLELTVERAQSCTRPALLDLPDC